MKKIAFICVHNSCRSQIAEALGKRLLSGKAEVYSAGTELKSGINPDAVRLMREIYGIDMEKEQEPKLIDRIPEIDMAISMGCGVQCPWVEKGFQEDWGLIDPTGEGDEVFRAVIKDIEERMLELKASL